MYERRRSRANKEVITFSRCRHFKCFTLKRRTLHSPDYARKHIIRNRYMRASSCLMMKISCIELVRSRAHNRVISEPRGYNYFWIHLAQLNTISFNDGIAANRSNVLYVRVHPSERLRLRCASILRQLLLFSTDSDH